MKTFSLVAFVSLVILTGISYAQDTGPVAVSPSSETGIARIGTACPTFSWTAVDWAVAYRLEVFPAEEHLVTAYHQMATMTHPVLAKEIPGAATSWTPTADEGLSDEGLYVWFIQAVDEFGSGVWSEGSRVLIDIETGFAAVEQAVSDTLAKHGVGEEIIDDVIGSMKEASQLTQAGDSVSALPISVMGHESDSNTWYGLDAGASITSGTNNSFYGDEAGNAVTSGIGNTFLGRWAGRDHTTGSHNTYLGNSAGSNSTTAFYNTVVGAYAGLYNTAWQNVFVGHNAGRYNTSGEHNTVVGQNAGSANQTGSHNSIFGKEAGYSNTVSGNSMFGSYSGYTNTTGSNNVFVGKESGYSNSTGYSNTFVGANAGYTNTTSAFNTFLGYFAGNANTTGVGNTFVGANAGVNNETASSNTFVGYGAGYQNTTGYNNTFIGQVAGYNNTEGYHNTFLGRYSGYNNTTSDRNTFLGYYAGRDSTGESNTFVGETAGFQCTSGSRNTTLGNQAGYSIGSGFDNTYIGQAAGQSNSGGYYNTFVGRTAGYSSTGSSNIFLGHSAGYNETGSHKLYIDNSNTSDPLIYGEFDNDIVAFMGTVGVGTKSPAFPMEMKKTGTNASIVVDRTDGATNFINATDTYGNFGTVTSHPLRFVSGSVWRMRLNTDNSLTMKNGASCTAAGVWTNASSRDLKENIESLSLEEAEDALGRLKPVKYNYLTDESDKYVGFIAEDVPELVATKDRKGMSPMDVTAVLTKVLQEQQEINKGLKKAIERLEGKVSELEKQLKEK